MNLFANPRGGFLEDTVSRSNQLCPAPSSTSSTSSQQQQLNSMKAPLHVPPKSPKSGPSFLLFGGTSANKPSKPRRRHRSRSKDRQQVRSPSPLSGESLVDDTLTDPSPNPFHVVDDDELSSTADFSLEKVDKSPRRRSKPGDSMYHQEAPKLFFRKSQCANVPMEEILVSGGNPMETAKEALAAGDYARAVSLLETLQEAQQKRFGEEHISVAAALHNVGVARLRMGDHAKGEETLIRAVAIRRKVLPNDHLDLAASLGKLGSARVVLRKLDDAHENLREAIRIVRKAQGRSKTMARLLSTLACLYFEAGELRSAQATFEDAVEIYSEVFSQERNRDGCMLQMTEAMCNVGSIQNKRKQFGPATSTLTQALDLQRGVMGHDNPRVIATLDNLGYSFSKSKSYTRAMSCYKEMLSAQLSLYGAFTPECCETLKKQLLMYEKLGDLSGAVKCASKVMDKAKSVPTSDDCISEINKIYVELKRRYKKQKR
eukprot:scaffold4243_cov126-Cylindrotheca_fusiformis.AAC.2